MSWEFLKKGDIVDVVAPGYPSQLHEIEAAHSFLESWGLRPRIPKGIVKPHFLHAHEDEQRFGFLRSALEAQDSRAIWCLRGGYGSNRLIPFLAKLKKPKKNKLFIGISDITSLHVFFTQNWGWKTLHGPLLDRIGRGLILPRHEREFHNILFGSSDTIEFKNLRPLNLHAKKLKKVESSIVGGNLTVLQSTLGTPWQIKCDNHFLFIEDIGERGYRVDRMLEHCRQAGVFRRCRGLLLGDFLGGEEPGKSKNNFDLVFKRWAKDLDLPVFSGMQAGHGKVQRPVPFNSKCVLVSKNELANLRIDSGGFFP